MPESNAAQNDLELVSETAHEAGQIAMHYFRKDPKVWYKNGASPVTEADIQVNEFLRSRLVGARPHYGWLSEESEDDQSRLANQTAFVVDPIDGTRAFVAGQDVWCVSVAIVHAGRSVAAALSCPARGELFTAGQTTAALKNGVAIRVAEELSGGKIASSRSVFKKLSDRFVAGLEKSDHIPSLAYRLAMVADGRLAATLITANAHDWDLAAADLILAKAGGAIVNLDGESLRYDQKSTTHGVLVAASVRQLPSLRDALGDIDI
ncbi:MAG: 3'(2'),5'-bisphosphate nucleotidase CysQ [Alphaproteobacteria bacterium]|nr:3'(2'),5'-bisphosphate nucleotidase CysQ [Alphaproteobacteria bacterium]